MAVIVRDLMTKDVACVRADQPLSVAAQLMWNRDCGAVPVVDGNQQIVGMLTDRDICMATWSKNSAPSQIKASEVMSHELHCCTPEESLDEAEHLMRSKQVRRLPVIDADFHVVGMLSLADIARDASPGNGVRPEHVGSTLANIVQPPQPPEAVASVGG